MNLQGNVSQISSALMSGKVLGSIKTGTEVSRNYGSLLDKESYNKAQAKINHLVDTANTIKGMSKEELERFKNPENITTANKQPSLSEVKPATIPPTILETYLKYTRGIK